MARRELRPTYERRVSGNLAYDYDRLAREERRRREWEEQENAKRRAQEAARKRAQRRKAQASPRRRARIRVSPFAVLGFAATTVMAIALLMGYARLSAVSHQVAERQRRLASLEEEHVRLLSRYERTFDLAAVREAAERAGMAKPSASQIYYIDLSEPDSVVLHKGGDESALGRITASAGRTLLEYFR